MGAALAVVGEFFAGDAVAAAGSEALAAGEVFGAGTAGVTAEGLAGAGALTGEAATAGAALAGADGAIAAGAVGAAGGGSFLGSLGTSVLGGVGSAVASSLLAPGMPQGGGVQQPKTLAPSPMPDPLAQQAATKKSIVEQTTRRGRASTVLTSPGNSSGRLGG